MTGKDRRGLERGVPDKRSSPSKRVETWEGKEHLVTSGGCVWLVG